MKRRVAIASSCCPPLPGRPVTGGGLRTAQLVATLEAAGHAVVLFVERAALPEDAPTSIRAFDVEDLKGQIEAARPSVVVVEQWALLAHLDGLKKPLVVDLHGSLLLENVYRRGEPDLVLDAGTKLTSLHRADLLLTPAPAQLHHFASWATLAGFDPRELPLDLLPLALPGEPQPRKAKKPPLRLVYGGARWPWIDSLAALNAAAAAVQDIDGATLDVFTYDPPRHGLPLEEDLGTWAEVDAALADRERVTHHHGVGQDEYAAFLRDRATVALDLWSPNPERLLAATTRSGEFLHAGLPVITVAGSAWAEELASTGAGWALPPDDDAALVDLLSALAKSPPRVAAASRAATALMAGPHSLEEAGRALIAFVAAPHRPPRSEATLVDAIVAVRQAHLDETLRSERAAHEDEHARLVFAHRAEVSQLRAAHRLEVDDLSRRHADVADQLRSAHRADVDRLTAESRASSEAQAARHDAEVESLRDDHKAEIQALSDDHRTALDAIVAEHREQADALASSYRDQMAAATAERKDEVVRIVARAQQDLDEVEARHRAELTEVVAGHRNALEDAHTAVERSASELEAAVEEHRRQMAATVEEHQVQMATTVEAHQVQMATASAEHRAEVEAGAERERAEAQARTEHHRNELAQTVVDWQEQLKAASEREQDAAEATRGAHATLEAEAARHRVELEETVASWQARLDTATERARSDRHQARESRTRLEVELRAELARTEAQLSASREETHRARGEVDRVRAELDQCRDELAASRATLAARLRDRLGQVEPLPGRARPALSLAKLWVEHALDRGTRGPGTGES